MSAPREMLFPGQWSAQDSRASALGMFRSQLIKGWLAHVLATLTGRRAHPLSLASAMSGSLACCQHYRGRVAVPVRQILGSESRSEDFDLAFRPLQDRTRERWLRVAMARLQDKPLPPVSLIQLGNSYFVRDGHHRLSVARALGAEYIDAEITVWQIAR